MSTRKILSLGLLVASLLSSVVNATPVIYFGENLTPAGVVSGDPVQARNNFLGALTSVGNEDFEHFAIGTRPPLALSFVGSAGNITASINSSSGGVCAPGNIVVGSITCSPFGRFATSGRQWFHTGDQFSINFSSNISAFGFYMTDVGDFNGRMTLSLTGAGGVLDLVVPTTLNAPDGSLAFFGFVDAQASYSSIRFGNTAAINDNFGFDDMVIGDSRQILANVVPEPASLGLFGLALAGIGFTRRRRS